ncbi:pogo transposable [Stemphylium lycopersici]|uniref:Pogo transposable n=1 Tax=Stemphylium lycopersici TaxID=183478 RepID=A0A364MRE1_STELY|nr:pogo transposable [Stemphylium lycopersici]RAQ98568.1 pogo transposable [Stemphylium lycopersici]RAQ99894.1 pogo transposable [Stemphylium lycopersici]
MDEYNLVPRDTYNMDEKGFMIGIVGRSKRVFSKSKWESKAVRQSVQDGNREWITLMACVCADGTALPPSLIYPSAENSIRSAWVDAIQAGEHEVFVSSLPTGWTNDAIGLAWLEQVFDRYTKLKSGRSRRLLILDGHGSHVTMDFIKYCDRNRILLAILPPHSTQTLQPLDVALFAPLSAAYSKELSQHLERAQGLIPINKGDFFKLFWRAWGSSFKTETTLSSFAATGISPLNPDAVLKKFTHNASTTRESSESSSALSVNDWRKMDRPARSAVKDQSDRDARKLRSSLHHICSPNTNFSIFGYPFQRPQ